MEIIIRLISFFFKIKVCPRRLRKTRLQVLGRPGKNSNRRFIIRFSQTPNSLYCQSTKVPYPKLFIQSRSPALVYFWDKQRVRKLTRSCFWVFVNSKLDFQCFVTLKSPKSGQLVLRMVDCYFSPAVSALVTSFFAVSGDTLLQQNLFEINRMIISILNSQIWKDRSSCHDKWVYWSTSQRTDF